jgi:hypothetical protein
MTTTYRIERRDVIGAWSVVRLGFKSLDTVMLEYKAMQAENPKSELRIIKVAETVIERTL